MFNKLATTNSSLLRWWRQWTSRHVSAQSPVIVGGCQRSGTTLLRVILDSHPHIACGPESSLLGGSFLPAVLTERFQIPEGVVWQLHRESRDHALFVERVLTHYAQAQGKPRWGEKTPQNVRHIEYIFRHFPRAKFIHIIRDGRDVVCSIRTHPRERIINGERVPTNIRRPLEPCIGCWLHDTAAGLRWRGHPQYYEVRYEQLVTGTEAILRELCAFLEEPWDPALLEYYKQARPARVAPSNLKAAEPIQQGALERWRQDLTDDELALVYKLAGRRLRELGYLDDAAGPGCAE